MSIAIDCENIVKKYGKNVIIPGLNLNIKNGEFFTLLGPSGCGKTTLLRMIIGFNSIEGGEIQFNGKVVNGIHPSKRNIGMVFQNYAIFPHLTVRQNIEFGLKNRKVPKDEIDKKVEEIMKIVKIDEYKDRLPENLSGGQQQRVALARAIVIHPDVLLMDEPLCNLDAKLRVEMRNAIKEIQNQIGITTVYVTHDQEEAMAISDRIAIMKAGVIQHVGTPQEIYQRPANTFVASFIGGTNILDRRLVLINGKCFIYFTEDYYEEMNLNLDKEKETKSKDIKVKVSVRPEEFIISKDMHGIGATVISSMFLGLNTHYFVKLETGEKVEIIQESTIEKIIKPGTKIGLTVKKKKINVFNEDGNINYTNISVGDSNE
ncbi:MULTISPECIES: ABC transporter ATP-binding protein [Clostridium]|uniref:Polyamine ABC transporter ATP-binding protein n=1 Tax=Clostridium beijerinckii TaxID=1520 RepID=A0A1S9NBU6_CLOBE|nr:MULTISPECIES: ABC transporter ATP-binding protein [Clostridium]MBN7573524.1 ABC transporter ATP-binding protein [Clostridium beijerinckii]MBN7579131.1 ABC transporter ATP-binding protein [Clostridium beijerinckii]MBN7583567.1 ABC transporter ATP-binding protein [Clostridium beijerinckii]MBO0519760.1 ABC transporter ATP-binding protein [Clostridium beijerinckii]MZK51270.1 ATP-binding cassette domain-containing protein [Clostridium beijerinckii]